MSEAGWVSMSNLFQFEFRRLFRRLSFYICTGIVLMMVMYTLFTIGMTFLSEDLSDIVGRTAYNVVSQAINLSNINIICAVFTAIFVCEDRAKGTIKTIYSLGYPRIQLFLAKFTASAVASAIMIFSALVISILSAAVLGADFSPVDNTEQYNSFFAYNSVNVFLYSAYEFTMVMALQAFYFMMSELIGKTGFAVVANIFTPALVYIFLAIIFGFVYGSLSALEVSEDILKILEQIATYFTMYWLPTMFTSILTLFGGVMDDISCSIGIFINFGYVILFGGLALLITYKKQVKN